MSSAIAWMRHLPNILFYAYFENREKFIYFEETYTEWTIFAAETGSFHYDLDGSTGTATYGDLLFCKPGVNVRRVVIAPPLTFHFLRIRWVDELGEMLAAPDAIPGGKISLRNTHRLASAYAELRNASKLPELSRLAIQNHYLRDIWYEYGKEAALQPVVERHSARLPNNPAMRQAAKLIREQAFAPLNLKDIAAALDISPYDFSRKFKAAHGVTPMHFLSALRLEKAKLLLIETELTLEQVAECCGYQSGFYINKLFMKQLEMTPVQYRVSHRV